MRLRHAAVLAASTVVLVGLPLHVASAARPAGPFTVLHVGQADREDVAAHGSEPDTLAEAAVAVSPAHPNIAVAAVQDGRFGDGGAVAISVAWTRDGGRHWRHAPVPRLTTATGGQWPRASDPAVGFGPDGSVYLSALVLGERDCPSGVAVARSSDGGRHWGTPHVVDRPLSPNCFIQDDKPWLAVDTHRRSPFYGRIYTAWVQSQTGTALLQDPVLLSWSGNHGRTWSRPRQVTARGGFTEDPQLLIGRGGQLTVAYLTFPGGLRIQLDAQTSRNGGRTWSRPHQVTADTGPGPLDIRCCLPTGAADPVTGELYLTWVDTAAHAIGAPVVLARSRDGISWTRSVVSTDPRTANIEHVNAAVGAFAGRVVVSYGIRDNAVSKGRYVQQLVAVFTDAGRRFSPHVSLGPRSDLTHAAFDGSASTSITPFPGDYTGAAATRHRAYVVWCVASRPPTSATGTHQTMWAASLLLR